MESIRILAVMVLVISACSGLSASSAVFVGSRYEAVECDGDGPCLRVFSEVEGTNTGRGSCILYASTRSGQVAVAASGELELVPGAVVEWIVPVPVHLGMGGWNPVCSPTAEG